MSACSIVVALVVSERTIEAIESGSFITETDSVKMQKLVASVESFVC